MWNTERLFFSVYIKEDIKLNCPLYDYPDKVKREVMYVCTKTYTLLSPLYVAPSSVHTSLRVSIYIINRG